MRARLRVRLLAILVIVIMVMAACGDDDDDDTAGGGGGEENTGTVNLLSAGEPEEVEAYQEIFDELINSETDYEVEIEAAGNFEEQHEAFED